MLKDYYPIDALPIYTDSMLSPLEGLDIILSINDEEVNEYIKKIRDIFLKNNINMRALKVSAPNMGKRCFFLVYEKGDKTDREIDKVITEILALEKVETVTKACRYKNFIYSCKQYPLTFLSKRIILLGPANLKALVIDSRKTLGPQIASLVLYNIGRAVGIEAHKVYGETIENITKVGEAIDFVKFILETTGWGILTEYSIDKNRIELAIKDLWECNILREYNVKDEAEYTKGVLTGLFEKLFKKDVTVRHIIMRTEKDTTYCVFEILR